MVTSKSKAEVDRRKKENDYINVHVRHRPELLYVFWKFQCFNFSKNLLISSHCRTYTWVAVQ